MARNAEKLQQVADATGMHPIVADIADPAAIEAAVAASRSTSW